MGDWLRRPVAAFVDTILALVLGYIAFRSADWTAHCRDQGSCVILTPLILLFLVVALGLYFGLPLLLRGRTVGQMTAGIDD